jgi:hypothetical protein
MQQYEIEKSLDGQRFNSIGHVSARNTATTNSYTCDDLNTGTGGVYYRIKMIDKDGSFRYSNIVSVRYDKLLSLSVYPNPSTGNVMVSHPAAKKGIIQIFNAKGQLMLSKSLVAGAFQSMLLTEHLPAGRYQVILQGENSHESCSFIKM